MLHLQEYLSVKEDGIDHLRGGAAEGDAGAQKQRDCEAPRRDEEGGVGQDDSEHGAGEHSTGPTGDLGLLRVRIHADC